MVPDRLATGGWAYDPTAYAPGHGRGPLNRSVVVAQGLKGHAEMTSELERDKELVRRLVVEAINDDKLAVLDEVCTERLALELREWFAPFRAGFPDWRQEIVDLVAENVTVVARCVCRGTNLGTWLGVPPTGRSMRVDEVWFFTVAEGRLDRMWSLEDTWSRLLQLGTAEQALEAARTDHRT
ncbi:MAG TPA: ester cyclase [Acidimicrobiales bacterium]|nr:ester cyclase [Acidimicrobiales bacterium]